MQYFCPYDQEVVERSDTTRGFEHAKEQYVEITDAELEALRAERSDRIDLTEFVPADSVDLLYIDRTQYLGPDKGGGRAYELLARAMERTGRIAVGRYGARGKDQLVLLRPYRGGLVMHQVFYADEVRPFDEVIVPGKAEVRPKEEELAERLIGELSADAFHPEKYHDEYEERLLRAIEQKVEGREVTAPPAAPRAEIINLFEALERSLSGKTKAAEPPAPPAPEAPPERPAIKKAAPRKSTRERKAG